MYPCTDHYLATLVRSHTQTIYVQILKDNFVVADLQSGKIIDPNTALPLIVAGGAVQVARQSIRRSCQLTLVDPSGIELPENIYDLLAPYSTEIRVWVGVRYWDAPLPSLLLTGPPADTELVPIGTFVITDLEADYPVITISGSDRMWYMANFVAPYSIAKGTKVVDALNLLLAKEVPASVLDTNFPDDQGADATTPLLNYDADSQTVDALHTAAQSAGWQIFADPMGTFIANHEPSVDDPEVLTLVPGPGGLLLKHPKRHIGGEMTNAVVFTNESGGTAAPLRGYAQDDNPSSLTYVGKVGRRPRFQSSPLMTTQDQVNKAARTSLLRDLGVSDIVSLSILPVHALDASDVVRVTDPMVQVDDKYITDSFTVNLRATDGPMEVACRSQVIR